MHVYKPIYVRFTDSNKTTQIALSGFKACELDKNKIGRCKVNHDLDELIFY